MFVGRMCDLCTDIVDENKDQVETVLIGLGELEDMCSVHVFQLVG